ncbi:hypothetical protein D3C85_1578550 [compost metagenome]
MLNHAVHQEVDEAHDRNGGVPEKSDIRLHMKNMRGVGSSPVAVGIGDDKDRNAGFRGRRSQRFGLLRIATNVDQNQAACLALLGA